MTVAWQKCFELQDGRPTGRWQWVLDGLDGAYYYPGRWLDPESFTPPLPMPHVDAEVRSC